MRQGNLFRGGCDIHAGRFPGRFQAGHDGGLKGAFLRMRRRDSRGLASRGRVPASPGPTRVRCAGSAQGGKGDRHLGKRGQAPAEPVPFWVRLRGRKRPRRESVRSGFEVQFAGDVRESVTKQQPRQA